MYLICRHSWKTCQQHTTGCKLSKHAYIVQGAHEKGARILEDFRGAHFYGRKRIFLYISFEFITQSDFFNIGFEFITQPSISKTCLFNIFCKQPIRMVIIRGHISPIFADDLWYSLAKSSDRSGKLVLRDLNRAFKLLLCMEIVTFVL